MTKEYLHKILAKNGLEVDDDLILNDVPVVSGSYQLLVRNSSSRRVERISSSALTPVWGNITGDIENQLDLITYIDDHYTPLDRILTINGVSRNLLADRTWSIDLQSTTDQGNATTNSIHIGYSSVTHHSTQLSIKADESTDNLILAENTDGTNRFKVRADGVIELGVDAPDGGTPGNNNIIIGSVGQLTSILPRQARSIVIGGIIQNAGNSGYSVNIGGIDYGGNNSYFNTILGYNARTTSNSNGNVVIGGAAIATSNDGVAVGRETTVGFRSITIGAISSATGQYSFALGYQVVNTADHTFVYGKPLTSTPATHHIFNGTVKVSSLNAGEYTYESVTTGVDNPNVSSYISDRFSILDLRAYDSTIRPQGSAISSLRAGGTQSSPSATPDGVRMFEINVAGYDGTTDRMGSTMVWTAAGDWSSTNRGTTVFISTAAKNSTNTATRFRINADGNIEIPSLDTGNTAPTTSGDTRIVISDSNGLLSFTDLAGVGYTVPDLQSVTDVGGATDNPITISYNSSDPALRISGHQSSLYSIEVQTSGSGNNAGVGLYSDNLAFFDLYAYRSFVGEQGSAISSYRAGGTQSSPLFTPASVRMFEIDVAGWDGTTWRHGATMVWNAVGNWSSTNRGTTVSINTVALNSTNNVIRFFVNANGNIEISSLNTGNTAPTTSGTTKMVICDSNGLLSFADIPDCDCEGGGGDYIPITGTDALAGDIIPNEDDAFDLGAENFAFKTLYLSDSVNIAGEVITATTVLNWNTAYGWGDHSGLYIPLSGTSSLAGDIIPTTTATYDLGSSSKTFKTLYLSDKLTIALEEIEDNDIKNWNDAYSWGDHADAGYALASSLATVATSGDYDDLINKPSIPTQYTDEDAQDAIGSMVSSEFTYDDATPSLSINAIAATKITDDSTHRFVTDTDILNWNAAYGWGNHASAGYFVKASDDTDDISEGASNKFMSSTEKTKLGYLTVTGAVDLDQLASDVAVNNTKVSNATHTGEVTGSTSLTLDKTAISNRTTVTADAADYILIADTSDSGNLKKALISDILGSGGTYTFSTGLTETSGTVTANLSTGVSGGQSVIGGTGSGDSLLLQSTTNGTKGLFQFEGSTSSFPALKRNGVALESVLADDSAYTTFIAGELRSANYYFVFGSTGGRGTLHATGDGEFELLDSTLSAYGKLKVADEAYDATTWNGNNEVPTKNAVRDVIESLSTGGGSPGGSDTAIQFNDSGVFEGASKAFISGDGNIQLDSYAYNTTPSTPASGTTLYAKASTGRNTLHSKDASGIEVEYQIADWQTKGITVAYAGMSTVFSVGFPSQSTAGTSGIGTISATTPLNSTPRITLTTGTGSNAGVRVSQSLGTAHLNTYMGFYFVGRFGLSTYNSGQRVFCGVSNNYSFNGNPSSLNNTLCIGKDSSDSTFQFIVRDGSSATKVDTGITPNNSSLYVVKIYAVPGGSTVHMTLIEYTSGGAVNKVVNTFTTGLPSSSTLLGISTMMDNASTGAALVLDYVNMYISTPF